MIASVRGEFSAGIASLRTEMQTNLNQATTKLRSDMNARIAAQPATTRTVGGINR